MDLTWTREVTRLVRCQETSGELTAGDEFAFGRWCPISTAEYGRRIQVLTEVGKFLAGSAGVTVPQADLVISESLVRTRLLAFLLVAERVELHHRL